MTDFEKIEQAYHLLLENTQALQTRLQTHAYDALVEQNALYLAGTEDDEQLVKANQSLRDLELTKEEWRKTYQFLLLKLAQTEPLQASHQFTPDVIGFIILFLLEELTVSDHVSILELGSGMGNLAQTLLSNSHKALAYLGMELDDLLIDLAASVSEVMGSTAQFIQGDAVRPHHLKESDVVVSDLPVGYYPNDAIAQRYQVSSAREHTYVHHLLMEQALKYVKSDGLVFFLAPENLLNSGQSELLKAWLKEHARVLAVISLPDTLFTQTGQIKSLFILSKSTDKPVETFVYPLSDVTSPLVLREFRENLKKWKLENDI